MGIDEMYAVTVMEHSLYNFTDQGLQTPNKPLAMLTAEALANRFRDSDIQVWKQVSSAQWHMIASMRKANSGSWIKDWRE